MYNGMTFQQLESAEKFPNGSIIPADMGDGSGVKKVTKELLEEEIGKDLIGNLEDLATEDKTSLVAAINEVAESGGGSVDVLDTKEEIEANTEPGKPAGALGVKEMFGELNNNITFPDGTGFYPDERDGIRGYNTDPARGADTFHPFNINGMQNATLVNANVTTAEGVATTCNSSDVLSPGTYMMIQIAAAASMGPDNYQMTQSLTPYKAIKFDFTSNNTLVNGFHVHVSFFNIDSTKTLTSSTVSKTASSIRYTHAGFTLIKL